MAQRFTSLDDAAKQLGVSKDRLNQLREVGKVRAYRDGQSWKFRSEDIDKLAANGIPQIDAEPSDIGLELEDEERDFAAGAASAAGPSGLDLEPADEESPPASPASDVNLEEVDEPTVAGEESEDDELAIDLDSDAISLSDSILLSDTSLGESPPRPPSTIIGKAELDADADLDLAPLEDSAEAAKSDVKLAPPSDILPAGDEDTGLELPSPSGDFAGLEELEVDLEAESSRILSADDMAKVKTATASAQHQAPESSDLQLAPTDSTAGRAPSDVGIGSDVQHGSATGLTGLSALELEEDEDEEVLGEGSDVTLSGESSGINIISPSDSGLALDQFSLSDASPIGSSLDLGAGSVAEGVALEPLVVGEGMESKIDEEFRLTPIGEDGAEDEEKDSSQVIDIAEAEEAMGEPLGAGAAETDLFEPIGVGLGAGAAAVPIVSAHETPFSMANVLGLGTCLLLLGLCGMMTFDLVRNIWSFDEVSALNSPLLDALARLFRLT